MITFTNNSTNAIGYTWDFGDGNTSTETNPVHIYTQDGTYNVTLVGQSDVCADETFSQSVDIQIIIAPTAALTVSANIICVGEELTSTIFLQELEILIHGISAMVPI